MTYLSVLEKNGESETPSPRLRSPRMGLENFLNKQSDYTRNRNYWKYLKNKLKQENPQLVNSDLEVTVRFRDDQ